MTSLCHCGRGSWRVHHGPLLIFSTFAFLTGNLCLVRHCKKCPVRITGQSGCRLRKNLPQCAVLQVPRKGRESARAMRSSLFQAGSLQTVQEVTKETARTSIQGRCPAKGQLPEVREQGSWGWGSLPGRGLSGRKTTSGSRSSQVLSTQGCKRSLLRPEVAL